MSPVTCQLTTFNPRTDFALSNGFRSPASDYLSGAMLIAYAATWGPPPQAPAGKTNQVNNNQPPALRQRRPRFSDRGLFNFQPPVSSLAPRRSRHLLYATLRPLKPSSDPAMNQQYTRGRC